MASACVNSIGLSPKKFQEAATHPSYGWLSPRVSCSSLKEEDESSKATAPPPPPTPPPAPLLSDRPEIQDPMIDFEFRLEDPVTMLPADELFSGGKLVAPLQVTTVKTTSSSPPPQSSSGNAVVVEARSQEKSCRRIMESNDPFLYSPKAPRCSSRWREILGLKKLYQTTKTETHKTTSSSSTSSITTNSNQKLLKHFLHRSSKSSLDHSLSLPLLKGSDCEPVLLTSSSSSSSSSTHDREDPPRLSLESKKPNPNSSSINHNNRNAPRMRMVKPRHEPSISTTGATMGGATRVGRSPRQQKVGESLSGGMGSRVFSADSPRMSSSGKIVFQSLERSSSSPGSFINGVHNNRYKRHVRGMERSYSANVRVTPVLNVPVCSLRGTNKSVSVFGFFSSSSPHKREVSSSSNNGQQQISNRKNRSDRT